MSSVPVVRCSQPAVYNGFKSLPKVHSGLRSGVAGWSDWFVRKVRQDEDYQENCHAGVDGEEDCHGVTSSFRFFLADDEVSQEKRDSNTDSVEHLTDAGGSGSLMGRKHKIINYKALEQPIPNYHLQKIR